MAQWSADNGDHNTVTLTGPGTFYGMESMETVTPGEIKLKSIKYLNDRKLFNEIINTCGKLPIFQYRPGPVKTQEVSRWFTASSHFTEC